MGHHPHIHALVPGSGPSLDGTRWVPCRYTQATRQKPARAFLVDNQELGRRFRDSYVRGVRRLLKAGLLEIDDRLWQLALLWASIGWPEVVCQIISVRSSGRAPMWRQLGQEFKFCLLTRICE